MKVSKITFLMTAHNSERFIKQSIESVLKQSEEDITLIIRNNGSTDNTSSICKSYEKRDRRLIYLENQVNWITDEGSSYYDRGWWPELHSEYVSIIDHDDILHQEFARIMYKKAKKTDAQITACGRTYFNDFTGELTGQISPPELEAVSGKEISPYFPKLYVPVCRTVWGKLYSTGFYEKYYDEVRQIPENLILSSDTFIVLGYLEKCTVFSSINEPLYNYRVGSINGFYSANVSRERILEGEILYRKGRQYLETVGIDTKENLQFLNDVYIDHMQDLLDLLEKSQVMSLQEKLIFLQDILAEDRFIEICEFDFWEIFHRINSFLEKVLPDISSQNSDIWKFYIIRIWDGFSGNKQDMLAYGTLLSGVFDQENKRHFGLQLLNRQEMKVLGGEIVIKRMTTKELVTLAYDKTKLLDILCKHVDSPYLREKEDQLATAVDQEEFLKACELLEEVTKICPESEYAFYYRIYIAAVIGEKNLAKKLAYIAEGLFEGTGNQAYSEIRELCKAILKESD